VIRNPESHRDEVEKPRAFDIPAVVGEVFADVEDQFVRADKQVIPFQKWMVGSTILVGNNCLEDCHPLALVLAKIDLKPRGGPTVTSVQNVRGESSGH
jgi:hypothetical protein